MKSRGLALAALACGLAIVVLAQRLAPIAGPPLYDGVIVEDPYRWLTPPSGFAGGAQSAADSGSVQGGQSPNLSVGTPEQPPQAQVFAGQGYLVMPSGTTTIKVSIEPVQPAAQPGDGVIAGNVYRISLTNQNGVSITGDPSGGVTVVLRGPANVSSATIERFSGGTWTPLQTDPAGQPNTFTAVVSDFGDLALVAPTGWVPAPPGAAPPVNVGPAAPPASTGTPAPSPSPASSAGSPPPVVLFAGLTLVLSVIVAGVVVFWLRSNRPKPVAQRPSRRPPASSRPVPPRRVGPKRRRR
jgi:hypothetical protein